MMLPVAIVATLWAPAAHAGVVSTGPAKLDAVYEPRRVAVLVGVQDYVDPQLQGLSFPAKDARDPEEAPRAEVQRWAMPWERLQATLCSKRGC